MQADFSETIWLAVLSALGGAVVAWLAFTVRDRAITCVESSRAEKRANQRIQLARELHDTLLQGVQGLLLTFHVVGQKMTACDESRALMERALSTTERIVMDARSRVGTLLPEHLSDAELEAALRNAGNDLNCNRAVQYSVKRFGAGATLKPQIVEEVFFIAREALANALQHAGATRVGLELDYGKWFFRMVCEDNGRGFGPGERERDPLRGVAGIEERARQLGGEVIVQSAPEYGTRVCVIVPSYLAYSDHSRLMFYLRTRA